MKLVNPEELRIKTLYDYEILDTPKEESFDEIVFLAATICQVPIALISLVDEKRQWFKAAVGTDIKETPRHLSFCSSVIQQEGVLIVPNLTEHEVFKYNPLVAKYGIMFYAGTPLIAPNGDKIGTLCVLDSKENNLTKLQQKSLQSLAKQVIAQLELRSNLSALQKSKNRLDEAQEMAKIGNWEWDIETNMVSWSKNQYSLFGRNCHESISYDIYLSHFSPEAQVQIHNKILAALAGDGNYEMQHEVMQTDGTKRYFLEKGNVVFKNGIPSRMYGTTQDITESKEMEAKLLCHQQALVQSSKMASLGQMASGIAHEINNPLAVLVAHIGLQMEDNLPSNYRHSLERMMGVTNRISDIVKGLRFIARDGSHENKQEVSLNKIINQTLTFCNEKYKKSGISLVFNSIIEPSVYCREVQISQVILNLLHNSFDAIEGTNNPWVEINCLENNTHLELSVTDSGQGISPGIKDKLFTPFLPLNPPIRALELDLVFLKE